MEFFWVFVIVRDSRFFILFGVFRFLGFFWGLCGSVIGVFGGYDSLVCVGKGERLFFLDIFVFLFNRVVFGRRFFSDVVFFSVYVRRKMLGVRRVRWREGVVFFIFFLVLF